MSLDSHILAMRTMFDPSRAGFDATYGLRLDHAEFRARASGFRFEIERGVPDHPDAAISTDPATLAAVLWLGRSLEDAMGGVLGVEGDLGAVRRLVDLFAAPAG